MNLKLQHHTQPLNGTIQITGSKSESNRLLILQKFYNNLEIENLGNSDDAQLMQKALASNEVEVDIHHAGTAMRFLTAYFSITEGRETILTGSKRMKERPIKLLVDALKSLGADIEYLENEGYPPIKLIGKKLTENKVKINGSVSSQYISALLLIAPSLENGIEIEFEGKVTSIPYIKMTLGLLSELGIENSWDGKKVSVNPKTVIENTTAEVESDWSSASYYYSFVALSEDSDITLKSYKKNSLQGDSALAKLYKDFGVETTFFDHSINLKKISKSKSHIEFDLASSPDIAQTIAVTCFGLGISCDLTGLHTLKIKETDRLVALKVEIEKLGGEVEITDNSLHLKPSKSINKDVLISTYNDHRMAMAFAPLLLKTSLEIEDANVVSKSYPDFWNDIEKLIK
ncbi:3-phosphoshikimate 1-carboxyvinyltransferase [Urechidicola croceus]|uniref:3-phosphoshikimate 1-carboxyvinyltransferase n=1 Tax=Urechidicola croceus TaxID=1850246 RepID=A0A1D8PAL8_9FLAO|nr:3-phosphoshikimate 1-carboxyvinyltransferase [Urechidicola croceus]AOW21585.1 3-phosphoshikimate 1-carboxyvinyltransferase [Urechidicola croceus]